MRAGKQYLFITHRQLVALHRVVNSLGAAGVKISVSGETDLLSAEEMLDLRNRLRNAIEEMPEVRVGIEDPPGRPGATGA